MFLRWGIKMSFRDVTNPQKKNRTVTMESAAV
jgi:hypothetical protein